MKRGVFITFEGGDGAGKTTLIDGIGAYLHQCGTSFITTRAPGGTPLGKEIRHLLLSKRESALSFRSELLLFLADRAQHVDEVIQPSLNQGMVVLCDRFDDSTIAYQGARGFSPTLVRSLCSFATEDLKPTLTFYLDIDPKIGLTRTIKRQGSADRLESEALHFHEEVRRGFHEIAKQDPERVKVIDALMPPEKVLEEAKKHLTAISRVK